MNLVSSLEQSNKVRTLDILSQDAGEVKESIHRTQLQDAGQEC